MPSDLGGIFAQPGEEGEELRPPRKLKSPANILAAARWTARQMMAGTLRAEQGLSTVRALELLLRMSEEVEPETLDLPTQRRLEAAELDRQELLVLRQRLSRYEKPDVKPEPGKSSGLFLRGADPVQAVDRRAEVQAEEPEMPHSTAQAILQDSRGEENRWH